MFLSKYTFVDFIEVLRHKKKREKDQERNSEKRKLKMFIFKMMDGVGRTILRF
jgi:hypothetical protein